MSEILTHTHGRIGHLSLNRPKAIHALTDAMCADMIAALKGWANDPEIAAVLVDHAEGRGFCSGGDIAMLRRSALEDGGRTAHAFFGREYRLNHLMFTYPKPIVAFMDGITMGGGVGISQPAKYRVATQNTRLAMPETGIGLFPDVGGGWYLSRLEGRLGQFLALTGARLDGAECLWAGLATHYLPADALAEAKARIIAAPDDIEAILAELSVTPPEARLVGNKEKVDRLFASDRLEDIFAALEADDGEWAKKELKTLRAKSPFSCKVSLEQLRRGAGMATFADNMAMEYRIGGRVILHPDFAEGVRAVIVDKTGDPHWQADSAEGVSDEDVAAIFAPLPDDEEWTPL